MTGAFLIYFALFLFVIYPFRDSLHPHQFCQWLEGKIPASFCNFIAAFRYWTFSLFYVIGDMWSTILLSLIFWNFINSIVTLEQAKRFYPLFSLDLAGICVGIVAYASVLFFEDNAGNWDSKLQFLLLIVIGVGLLQMLLFRQLCKKCIPDQIEKKQPYKKNRTSWKQKFTSIFQAPHLFFMALIVFSFEFTDNMFDVVWKHQLGQQYPSPEQYSTYASAITFLTGVTGILTVVFLSGRILRKFPWVTWALITPTLAMVTSFFFFCSLIFPAFVSKLGAWTGWNSLETIIAIGAVQSILMQVAKYTFFDNSKEIAFLLQEEQERAKSKAFADAFASRVGKSGASFLHQCLLVIFLKMDQAIPYVGIFVVPVIMAWWFATLAMNKLVYVKMKKHQEEGISCA